MFKLAIDDGNVAEKLGMSHDGRQRDEIVVNDVVMDVDIYGILRREFVGCVSQRTVKTKQINIK